MRVRMLTTAAGPDGVWMAGATVELTEEQAHSLLGGGYAEAVPATPAPTPEPEPAPQSTAEAPQSEPQPAPVKKKGNRARR